MKIKLAGAWYRKIVAEDQPMGYAVRIQKVERPTNKSFYVNFPAAIAEAAKVRPIVIQSLFLKIRGEGPSAEEIGAFCQRLREIGNIKLVQVYTLARKAMTVVDGIPAWEFVSALSNEEVDAITERVGKEDGVTAESFYGG